MLVQVNLVLEDTGWQIGNPLFKTVISPKHCKSSDGVGMPCTVLSNYSVQIAGDSVCMCMCPNLINWLSLILHLTPTSWITENQSQLLQPPNLLYAIPGCCLQSMCQTNPDNTVTTDIVDSSRTGQDRQGAWERLIAQLLGWESGCDTTDKRLCQTQKSACTLDMVLHVSALFKISLVQDSPTGWKWWIERAWAEHCGQLCCSIGCHCLQW